MLKVGGIPILERIIMNFVNNGYYNFYISTQYKSEIIKDYFGSGSNWNVKINYIEEKEPLGTAGALGLLPNEISKSPVIIMNGEILNLLMNN